MVNHLNRFSPDTCKCVIDFTFKDELPLDQQEASYQLVSIQKCSAHQALSDSAAYTAATQVDNKNKNKVEGLIMSSFSALTTLNADGSKVFNPGIQYNWSFDASRVLQVSITGAGTNFKNADKVTLQTLCDTQLGAGKIKIN